MGSGILLFLGNGEEGCNYEDNTYTYRQDSSFLYYFGLDYSGLAAIIDVEEGREMIFGDELTMDDIVWTGVQPTIHEMSLQVGVGETRPMKELKAYIDRAVASGREIHFLPPYRASQKVWLQALLNLAPECQAERASLKFCKAVIAQRNYKSAEEIEQIDMAVDITVEMHKAAMRTVRPGIMESEVAAAAEQVSFSRCCTLSFPTIATINGQTLHNHLHDSILTADRMFLLDAGAENMMHYAGDLTSTIPVGDDFTPRQKEIYNLNVAMFRTAAEALRPGITYLEVHKKAALTMVEGMKQLGLMKGDARAAVEEGAYALFFVHGLGHMMGLDVHDMENLGEVNVGYAEGERKDPRFGYKSLRLARRLEPGFCFTVEPGIYFIPDLIDMWRSQGKFTGFINYDKVETYKDFGGIRNEMDFLITGNGARRLGTKVKPLTIEEVLEVKNSK